MLSVRKYTGGPRAVRDYGSSLGTDRSTAMSLKRVVSADILHRSWHARGSDIRIGPPVADVALVNGQYARQYSGARLSVAAGTDRADVEEAYEAIVYVAGIRCIQRGDDQLIHPPNEPYVIVTPIDTSNTAQVGSMRLGVFENVNSGTWLGLNAKIWQGRNPASLQVSLVVMEQDGGQEGQVRREVEKAMKDVAGTVAQAYGAATGKPTFWIDKGPITDKVFNAAAFVFVKVLGLGDDAVGYAATGFNYDDLRGNPPPTVLVEGTKTRGQPLRVDGGKEEGIYDIYFYWETRPVTSFE